MKICDTHIHLADCEDFSDKENYSCLSCALNKKEFEKILELKKNSKSEIFISYGLHPQNPIFQCEELSGENLKMFYDEISFLESLLKYRKIDAIGEVGLDFFTPELRKTENAQLKCFKDCIESAKTYSAPLIIHNRKAFSEMLRYSDTLAKIPAVIFHSFSFTVNEAQALLKRKINAYFSFGKSLLLNHKKQIECAKKLPLERILLETDAPFQARAKEIEIIYSEFAKLRQMELTELYLQIEKNFDSVTVFTNRIKNPLEPESAKLVK